MGEIVKILNNLTIGRLRANGTDKCYKCSIPLKAGIEAVKKRGSRKQRWFHLECFRTIHY